MQPGASAAPTTSSQAMQQMQQFESGMKTPDQQLQQEQQNLGTTAAQQQVSGLRQAINNTTSLLNNVAPSVMGRTGNSLVTTAQANAQIANQEAPINQELNQQQQDYSSANQDYTNLEQRAENLASSDQTAQANQLGYLQNIYQALYGQEQNTAAQQAAAAQAAQQQSQFEQSLAEQQREANLSASTSGTAAPSLSLGNNNPQQNGMNMSQRNGGGFNFTGTSGQAISAGAYAKANNIPIGTLLQQMGQKGDIYARQAYNEIKANQAYYNAHPEALKQEFSPLFWGT